MSKIFCVLYHIRPLCIFSINAQAIISSQSLSSRHKDADPPNSLLSKMCVCQIKQTSVIPLTAGRIPVGCQPPSPPVVGRVGNRINDRPSPAISILHILMGHQSQVEKILMCIWLLSATSQMIPDQLIYTSEPNISTSFQFVSIKHRVNFTKHVKSISRSCCTSETKGKNYEIIICMKKMKSIVSVNIKLNK